MNTFHENASQAENTTLFQFENSKLSRTGLFVCGSTALIIALSFLSGDPNISDPGSQKTATLEDWHGNVARSR